MHRTEFYKLFGFADREDKVRAEVQREIRQSLRRSTVAAVVLGGVMVFTLLQSFGESRLLKLSQLSFKGLSPFRVNQALEELVDYGERSGKHSWGLQFTLIGRIAQNLKSQAYRQPKTEACNPDSSLEAVKKALKAMETRPDVQKSEKVLEGLTEYLKALMSNGPRHKLSPLGLGVVFNHLIEHSEDLTQTCISLQQAIETDDSFCTHLSSKSLKTLTQNSLQSPCTDALVFLSINPVTRTRLPSNWLPSSADQRHELMRKLLS